MMKRQRAKRAAGFTLVELMIALTISGIVIGAMYSVGSASSRHFQVQHQAANMQSALRFAMLQVKRDIQRAGYLSTPRAGLNLTPLVPEDCGDPGISSSIQSGGRGWIAGISSYRDNASNVVDPTGRNAANGFVADQLTMIGNYLTSNEYPGVTLGGGNNNLTLNINPATIFHSLEQDFGWDINGRATNVLDPGLVQRAFPAGGLIRIKGKDGMRHFAILDSAALVAGTTIRLEFTPPVPSRCAQGGNIDGGWVAPLQSVRYGASLSANPVQSDRATGSIAQLVRTQLMPRNMDTIMNGTVARVVLDYLAAFDLSFTMTNDTGLRNPDDYVIGQGSINNTRDEATVNNNPERIRSINVTLAVRAASTDPGMRFYNCGNLRCFQLNAGPDGGPAARVRVLRTEIFLPNIAYEGY